MWYGKLVNIHPIYKHPEHKQLRGEPGDFIMKMIWDHFKIHQKMLEKLFKDIGKEVSLMSLVSPWENLA